MRLLIQKFGGTSVATPEARTFVHRKIRDAREEGWSVVAVVSAMGRRGDPYATDTLLDTFAGGNPLPNSREQDGIYACGEIISGSIIANELRQQGVDCVFLNGVQAGIVTDSHYANAAIRTVRTEAIRGYLEKGLVVLVAGGQGGTERGDFTSIGRGGSDTTACALGFYLNADEVRIYTDVDGIYTADPRIIPDARPIPYLSYDHCQRLAECGAKVIHPKAVAFSRKGGRDVLSVRSTFSDGPGTKIGEGASVCMGITATRGVSCLERSAEEHAAIPEENLIFQCRDGTSQLLFVRQDGDLPGSMFADGGPRDVIFVVGPGAGERLKQVAVDDSEVEMVRFADAETAVVAAKPGCCDALIHQLHRSLCMREETCGNLF